MDGWMNERMENSKSAWMSKSNLFCSSFVWSHQWKYFRMYELWQQKKTTQPINWKTNSLHLKKATTLIYYHSKRTTAKWYHKIRMKKKLRDKQSIRLPCPSSSLFFFCSNRCCLWSFWLSIGFQNEFKRRSTTIKPRKCVHQVPSHFWPHKMNSRHRNYEHESQNLWTKFSLSTLTLSFEGLCSIKFLNKSSRKCFGTKSINSTKHLYNHWRLWCRQA